MGCANWKRDHVLPPYDMVSRRKQQIKWGKRVCLWIAIIVCFYFFIRAYIVKQPVKVSIEWFDHKKFPVPETTFCFNGDFEFSGMKVFLFDENNTLLDNFAYDMATEGCLNGTDACSTPLFQKDTVAGVPTGHCLSILENDYWAFSNFKGKALVFGFGKPAAERYSAEFLSEVVDIIFDTKKCYKGHHCESITTSSVIPSHGFSTVTFSKDTIVDKHNKYIITYPFNVGSVTLSNYYLNAALTDVGQPEIANDTLFVVQLNTNAQITTKTYLERPYQTVIRILESALGVFGGIVILGEIAMLAINKMAFTGTDTVDHEIRDPVLYLIREQEALKQGGLKPPVYAPGAPGQDINMVPMGMRA